MKNDPWSTPRLSLMNLWYKILFSNRNVTSLLPLRHIQAEARLCFLNDDRRRRDEMKRWHLCRAVDYCLKECPCEILELNVNSLFCNGGPIWSRFCHKARFFLSFLCALLSFVHFGGFSSEVWWPWTGGIWRTEALFLRVSLSVHKLYFIIYLLCAFQRKLYNWRHGKIIMTLNSKAFRLPKNIPFVYKLTINSASITCLLPVLIF